jgi:hypothetical protein
LEKIEEIWVDQGQPIQNTTLDCCKLFVEPKKMQTGDEVLQLRTRPIADVSIDYSAPSSMRTSETVSEMDVVRRGITYQWTVLELCLTTMYPHCLPQRPYREWNSNRFRPHSNLFQDTVLHFVERGMNADNGTILARIGKVNADKKDVKAICKREIEKLMKMGADITKMTHTCKLSGFQRLCTTPTEMRKSWCEGKGDDNVKPLLWIFHQLPWGTHQAITLRERTHQDLVEGGGGQGRNEYQLLQNRRAIQPQEEELHTADIHFVPQQQKTRHNEERIL